MELDACIKGRRSVRAYTDEPVSKEHIEAIIEAGTWAPTGMNRQPWKFMVIQNKQTIKAISDQTKALLKQMRPEFASRFSTEQDIICYDAPVLILICSEKDKQWENLNLIDCVLSAQNMFLKAYELGLGTCYMGFVSYLNSNPEVLKKMGVPDNYRMTVPLIVGHPKTKQEKGKRNKPEILTQVFGFGTKF
jgi:nitroreductase